MHWLAVLWYPTDFGPPFVFAALLIISRLNLVLLSVA